MFAFDALVSANYPTVTQSFKEICEYVQVNPEDPV